MKERVQIGSDRSNILARLELNSAQNSASPVCSQSSMGLFGRCIIEKLSGIRPLFLPNRFGIDWIRGGGKDTLPSFLIPRETWNWALNGNMELKVTLLPLFCSHLADVAIPFSFSILLFHLPCTLPKESNNFLLRPLFGVIICFIYLRLICMSFIYV